MSLATIARIFTVFIFAASLQASPPFNQVFLKATHNSYANTPVGTILQQLNSGCRIIELDIYDTQLATAHDFLVGHSAPGNGVHLGDDNPKTPALAKWLELINDWSDAHPHHAPIVIYFDLKNGSGYDNGSLALLDDEVSKIFGKKRYLAWQYPGAWPSVDDLRGKVMTVLTGAFKYRIAYRWTRGDHLAVAMNRHGQIVCMYQPAPYNLWYWAGQYEPDGTIAWRRHGKMGVGNSPAIELDDHGDILETDCGTHLADTFYCSGKLQQSGDIAWQSPAAYSSAAPPRIKFHRSVSMPLAPQTRVELPDHRWVEVSTGADILSHTLHYSTQAVSNGRITYEQRSFDECDMGDALLDHDGLLFYTAPFPSGITWARAARQQGKIVRLWMFNKITPQITTLPPAANYPATDYPYAPWYDQYMVALHAMQ